MKKGFTLIELLSVIVILAIIAVIAVPIVLDIINDSKESAILMSADFYLKGVETSIATSTIKDVKIKDGTYKIMQDGNVCIGTFLENDCDGSILKVEIDGEAPNEGNITIESGEVTYATLVLENKTIKKTNEGKLVYVTNLANYIKNLYSETTTATVNNIEYSLDETHSLMNDRLGDSEVGKTAGNIRYYGANPNNYIDIGDRDSEGNIIFWRIIGLFKNIEVTDENDNEIRTEDLVKIIRAESIGEFSWDYAADGSYDNNWNDSILQIMLNNAYYNSGTTAYYNNSATPLTLDFTSTGLSNKVHNKVSRVKWNLDYCTTGLYVDSMYKAERLGINTLSGSVALMHVSDYGYSADLKKCQSNLYNYNESTCKSTNWIYESTKTQWTLIPNSTYDNAVFAIVASGSAHANVVYSNDRAVRPVLYLKSDVGIVEEKETSEGLKYFVVE